MEKYKNPEHMWIRTKNNGKIRADFNGELIDLLIEKRDWIEISKKSKEDKKELFYLFPPCDCEIISIDWNE